MAKKKKSKGGQAPLSPKQYIKTKARLLPIYECLITEDWEEFEKNVSYEDVVEIIDYLYEEKFGKSQGPKDLNPEEAVLHQYKVSFEPIAGLTFSSDNEREEAEEILQLLVAGKAKKAIRVLKHEIELHPENPIYYNYLSNAYAMADDLSAANEVIVECYKKFPHYLFGRINYAQYLLDNNRIDEIPDVFDNQFELQAIYPERTEFHVYLVLKFT